MLWTPGLAFSRVCLLFSVKRKQVRKKERERDMKLFRVLLCKNEMLKLQMAAPCFHIMMDKLQNIKQ
jgi:hypothetical protein